MMPPTPPPGTSPSMSGNPNFRPRDVFEVFKEGFSTAGKVLPAFIVIVAIVALLNAMIGSFLRPNVMSSPSDSTPVTAPTQLSNVFSELFFVSFLIEIVLKVIFSASMATFVFISYHYQKTGEKLSFGEAFQRAQPFLLTFIIIDVIIHFLIQFGIAFFIIPGLFFAVWWSVALPVLFEEKRGIFDTMSRSKDLVQGFKWHVLGYLIIINLAGAVLASIVQQAIMVSAIQPSGSGFTINQTTYILSLFAGSFINYFFDGVDYMARPILFMDLLARQEQRRMMMTMYYPPQPGMGPAMGSPPATPAYPQGSSPPAPGYGPSPPPSAYQYPPTAPSTVVRACQNCGSPLEANARFCPSCGTPISVTPPVGTQGEAPTTVLTCKACGHSNPNDAVFCENCGTRLR